MNTTPSKVSLGNGKPDYATINALLASRIHNAGVPFVRVSEGSLGGFWTCVTLSLDARETWNYNILENSRFARLSVTVEGVVGARVARDEARFVVELFSGGGRQFTNKKFRKFRANTLEDVADKIADWALLNALPADVAAKRIAA